MDTFLQSQFICDYCHKISKGEANFLKHRCKQMERMEMLRTKEGLLAKQSYDFWLKCQRRQMITDRVFINTNTFTSFVKFANFVFDVRMDDWKQYIKLMSNNKISPNNWLHVDIVSYYINLTNNSKYEDYIMGEFAQLIDNPNIIEQIKHFSPLDLLQSILNNQIPVVLVLYSKILRSQLNHLKSSEIKQFDRYCEKNEIAQIMKDEQLVNKIKTLIQHMGF